MQLQQLEYLIAIADAGSLNKAAEKLYITQPSLSKAIANLEDEIKVKIFTRSKTGVELTDEGKKIYQYAQAILDRTDLIRRLGMSAEDLPGTLTIASYPIVSMGRWIAEFYNSHKEPYLNIRMHECRAMRAIEMVENGEAELSFLMFNEEQAKEIRYALRSRKLEFHELGTDTWQINLGPANPLYDRKIVKMQELLDFPYVRMSDDYFSTLTFFLKIDGIPLKSFSHVIHANDTAAILSILKYTDAVRFGPTLSKEDMEEHGIRSIPVENCDVKITVGWVDRKKYIHSQETLDFIKLLEGKCQKRSILSEDR